MSLYESLVAARAAMHDPKRTGDNPAFHSKFIPRDEVLATVVPACLAQGVFITQGVHEGNLVTTAYQGEEWLVLCRWPLHDDPNPQRYMAQVTYASRGSYMQVFALAGDDDDDGNTAAEPKPQAEAKAKPKAKPEAPKMSKAQGAAIAGMFKELAFDDDARHEMLTTATGRPDAAGANLTHDEADAVIKQLTTLHSVMLEDKAIASLGATEVTR